MFELVAAGALLAVFVSKSLDESWMWRHVAKTLGLQYSRSLPWSRTLDGTFRGFSVRAKETVMGRKRMVHLVVHDVDPGFTLGRDGALLRVISPDLEVGDGAFDQRTRIQGDAARAVACLDDRTRRLVDRVFHADGGKLADGKLETVIRLVRNVPDEVRAMVNLSARLRRPSNAELPELLARQALKSQSEGMRRTAFRRLVDLPDADSVVLATARELLSHFSAQLRLDASRVLRNRPEDADGVAQILAEMAESRELDSATRCDALEVLADSPRRDVAVHVLTAILDSDSDSGAAPQDVLRAAINGLVLVGDLQAVPCLRRLAGSGQHFRSAVARAAELAIEEIKGRAGGTQGGEISLVGVSQLEGAVSPADEAEVVEGGEVSIA